MHREIQSLLDKSDSYKARVSRHKKQKEESVDDKDIRQWRLRNYCQFVVWCNKHFGSIGNFSKLEYCQFEHHALGHGKRIFISRGHPGWNTWFVVGITSGNDNDPIETQCLVNLNFNHSQMYVFAEDGNSKLVEQEYCDCLETINNQAHIYISEKFYRWLKRTSV